MYDNEKSFYEIHRGTNKNMIVLFNLHCKPYKMEEEDKLILEVRDYRNNNDIVIKKETIGDNYFSFIPSDTEELDIGYYRYNVKLCPADSDEIYQIIEPSLFLVKAGE